MTADAMDDPRMKAVRDRWDLAAEDRLERLAEQRAATIREHVDACPACQSAMETEAERRRTAGPQLPEPQPFLSPQCQAWESDLRIRMNTGTRGMSRGEVESE